MAVGREELIPAQGIFGKDNKKIASSQVELGLKIKFRLVDFNLIWEKDKVYSIYVGKGRRKIQLKCN